MIANGGKAKTGRDSTGPSQGTEERGLGNTVSSTSFENQAGLIVLGKIKGGIGVVADAVAHRQEELHRLINRIDTFSDPAPREVPDDPMVTVDDGSGVR